MHKKEKSIPWNSMKKIERKGKSGNTDAGKVCFGTLFFAGKSVPKGEKDSFFLGWDNSMTKKRLRRILGLCYNKDISQ